ncbi:MAG TPA: hypothetical protein VJ928_03655 [Marivita sp.]|nr:hypothetical protein [Marivita sp.]
MMRASVISALLTLSSAAFAFDVGSSEYVFSSDLSAQGFTPFGTGGAANDIYGMTDGDDIYLCFLFDTPEDQSARQTALIAELQGSAESRSVPNIPVVCVLTQ